MCHNNITPFHFIFTSFRHFILFLLSYVRPGPLISVPSLVSLFLLLLARAPYCSHPFYHPPLYNFVQYNGFKFQAKTANYSTNTRSRYYTLLLTITTYTYKTTTVHVRTVHQQARPETLPVLDICTTL
jgi:hypothetical protein